MSAPEPEILTMEEVREIAANAPQPATTYYLPRLCATVEHWSQEAAESLEANARCAAAKEQAETNAQELGLERDRLRALVAGMRAAIEDALPLLDVAMWRVTAAQARRILADPDGQRAAEEAAKDREDAEKWRAMCATTDRMLKEWDETDPMTRLAEAAAEESEELRLLREVEAATDQCPSLPVPPASRGFKSRRDQREILSRYEAARAMANAGQERIDAAWMALRAFRVHQKGAPR